jgi:hypothetical protein
MAGEVAEKWNEMFKHFCCVAIDAGFLCLWAAMNFGVNAAVNRFFKLQDMDKVIGFVLQVLFGIATLTPVGISIYRDTRVMWIRANRRITQAADAP